MITHLTHPFTHLEATLTDEFSKTFAGFVKEIVVDRLSKLTEKEIKDVDKDELSSVIWRLREFLMLGSTH